MESILQWLGTNGGVPGAMIAIALALYLRRQKALAEIEEKKELREIKREEDNQKNIERLLEIYKTLEQRIVDSDNIQKQVFNTLTILVERLTVLASNVKDRLDNIKDAIKK